MAATANPDVIMRSEFESTIERMGSRLTALESNESQSLARIDKGGRALSGQSEVVTQNEFRLFKWLGTFVVAAVLGAFGVIYQQIADVRVDMRDLHNMALRELHTQLDTQIGGLRQEMTAEIGGLRQEMTAEIGGLRQDMTAEIGGLRQDMTAEIGGLRQDMTAEIGGLRQEMRAEIGGLRQEMKANHDSVLEAIGSLRERVARVETLLVGEEPRAES